MNIKRGLLRLWMVGTVLWFLFLFLLVFADKNEITEDIMKLRDHSHSYLVFNHLSGYFFMFVFGLVLVSLMGKIKMKQMKSTTHIPIVEE